VEITGVRLLNAQGEPTTEIHAGDSLRVELSYRTRHSTAAPTLQVYIARADGLACYDINSLGQDVPADEATCRRISLDIERIAANRGLYFVDVGAYAPNWAYPYDYHSRVYPLLVRSNNPDSGAMCADYRWKMQTLSIEDREARRVDCPRCGADADYGEQQDIG
jgi:hypothetical protein